jgi:hypothetical protein
MVDWEKNWRGNGVVAAVLFLAAEALYRQAAEGTRILIATPRQRHLTG